jgi:hypothetical protein
VDNIRWLQEFAVPARSRSPSQQDLLDERAYQPRLKSSTSLAPAVEATAEERARASQLLQVLQARPEDLAGDRLELDKLDRAIVSARKQVFAAKAETETLKTELEKTRNERTSNNVVYGLGGLAAICFLGWAWERRRMLARQPSAEPARPREPELADVPAERPTPPASSEFDGSDLEVTGDEADQWIERARVAMPDPAKLREAP